MSDTGDPQDISDGYHTFRELYHHRIELWIALCRSHPKGAWRSATHSDGTSFVGWFVLGMFEKQGEQITYHLPMTRWKDCDFAATREYAPHFDGHTSADVVTRLKGIGQ